jgi:5'-phosphate synthase pdxT subunit
MKRIGVLALQGAYQKHVNALTKLGAQTVLVKSADDFTNIDGLIIPGGESTTMGLLIQRYQLQESFQKLHAAQKPIWGTCAGMILLAKEIEGSDQYRLGWMDIAVARNAYGRQIDSFEANLDIPCLGAALFHATFIRAPKISNILAPSVKVLASYQNEPVYVQQDHLLASSFHPELSDDLRMHQYFLNL